MKIAVLFLYPILYPISIKKSRPGFHRSGHGSKEADYFRVMPSTSRLKQGAEIRLPSA